jgi:hypothetical protein
MTHTATGLPGMSSGFHLGTAAGLRLGLEILIAEVEHEQTLAVLAAGAGCDAVEVAHRHEYAAGVLGDLAAELGRRFRQVPA